MAVTERNSVIVNNIQTGGGLTHCSFCTARLQVHMKTRSGRENVAAFRSFETMIINKQVSIRIHPPPAHHTWQSLIISLCPNTLQSTSEIMLVSLKWLSKFQKMRMSIDYKESLIIPFRSTLVQSFKKLILNTSQSQMTGSDTYPLVSIEINEPNQSSFTEKWPSVCVR